MRRLHRSPCAVPLAAQGDPFRKISHPVGIRPAGADWLVYATHIL